MVAKKVFGRSCFIKIESLTDFRNGFYFNGLRFGMSDMKYDKFSGWSKTKHKYS